MKVVIYSQFICFAWDPVPGLFDHKKKGELGGPPSL